MAEVGREFLVRYDVAGPAEWHARLLLARVDEGNYWVILTPDEDIYGEVLSTDENPDLLGCVLRPLDLGAMPEGVQAGRVYDFTDRPTAAEFARWRRQAQTEAVRLRRVENIPDPGAGGAIVVADIPGGMRARQRRGLPPTQQRQW